MTWGSIGAFLHMGGYGVYVWGAYGVTLALLVLETVATLRRERSTLARVKREQARTQHR